MDTGPFSRETLLEIGIISFLLSLVAGFVVLVGGRMAGNASREDRESASPPGPGEIATDRHRNVANASAR